MKLTDLWKRVYEHQDFNWRINSKFKVTLPKRDMEKLQADLWHTVRTTGLFLHDEVKLDPEKSRFLQIHGPAGHLFLEEGNEFKIEPYDERRLVGADA